MSLCGLVAHFFLWLNNILLYRHTVCLLIHLLKASWCFQFLVCGRETVPGQSDLQAGPGLEGTHLKTVLILITCVLTQTSIPLLPPGTGWIQKTTWLF